MDWNGDGLDDIIVGDRNGYLTYFKRTGPGVDDLTSEGHMSDGSGTIDVGSNSAPVIVDWDEDGVLDLLIANEATSQGIRLYINSGTTTNPVLTTWSYIQSGGSNINRYRCCPQVYDMNADGKKDLIIADNSGKIFYYENVGTDAAPVFNGFVNIQCNGSSLDVGYGSRFWVDDWNEDGLPDLIASEMYGKIFMYMAGLVGVSEDTSVEIQTGFSIHPLVNPAQGFFDITIQNPVSGNAKVQIYDSVGRQIAETSASSLSGESSLINIDAGALATGVYTVVATSGSDISSCRIVLID